MKKASFDYSLKNIPIPPNDNHARGMVIKCEHFLQRLRWKVIHFFNKSENQPATNNFGFKTPKSAPQHKSLVNFENDLGHLVSNLEYRDNSNKFQNKMRKDVKFINMSKNILVKADKTKNIYEIKPEQYSKLMRENVTANYEKTESDIEKEINLEAKIITEKLNISDRVEKIAPKSAYITIKDHKEDFQKRTKCRLINPSKSNIGKIAKQILDEINSTIRRKTGLRQLKNTKAAIDWFKSIKFKTRHQFLQIDIKDYYPSISIDLLNEAIQFARKHTCIEQNEIEIIMNASKTVLFHDNHTWKKSGNAANFDIAMGAYHGAEITDLIGLFILDKLKREIPEIEFGLYRDDGMGIHRRIPVTKLNQILNKIKRVFQTMGLEITHEKNLTKINFLDVTFDLSSETFEQYRKPNDYPQYVHMDSNHPRSILKNIPFAVNKRLNEISCSKEMFTKHSPEYQSALDKSGFNHKMKYTAILDNEIDEKKKRKTRKRKILYFNPPFSRNLKTNIGKEFLKIIDKNFPKDHPLHKIINRKTVKVSYSCTQNIEAIIQSHNKKLLDRRESTDDRACNCRSECILPGKCRSKSVVYKATTKDHRRVEYIGSTAGDFKVRFSNHKASFKNEEKRNETALSQYVWENGLNRNSKNEYAHPDLKWEILKECQAYSGGQDSCNLCVTEKLYITRNMTNPNNINHRSDLGGKCIHRRRAMLSEVT